jgi:hypothetical protein
LTGAVISWLEDLSVAKGSNIFFRMDLAGLIPQN